MTNVSTFNEGVAIIQGDTTTTTGFNQRYYSLPDARYAIYGLTNFDIPTGSTCTTLKMNATLDNIDTYTVTTPNSNIANVLFVADIFTKSVTELCQPANGALLESQIFTLGKKSYFTVPT
jgi:hypothetical protein